MIKKLLYFAIIVCVACGVVSCEPKQDEPPFVPDKDAKHTALVYMMADNNLGYSYHFDATNIEAMCEAFIDNDINGRLMIFLSQRRSDPYLLEILSNDKHQCYIDTLKVYEGCLSTDTATLGMVMRDVREISKTPSYGLFVWTHATGWLPQYHFYKGKRREAPASIGLEGKEQLTMDIDLFAEALKPYRHEYIIFDACMMSCVEVAYELRDVCDHIIATPTETMGAGFPYYDIVPLIFADTIDYEEVCRKYSDEYINNMGNEGTIALIETRYMEELAEVCERIVRGRDADIAAIDSRLLQYYDRINPHVFYDLVHYMQQLADEEQCAELEQVLDKAVPYKEASPKFLGITIDHYSGVSSYIPGVAQDAVVEEYYRTLQWYKRVYENIE